MSNAILTKVSKSCSALCGAVIFPLLFLSQTAISSTVDEKVKSADFVFQGIVVDVQTRFSERQSESDPAIPYRFVTYEVNRVLKGNYQNNLVTLRFLGGESEDGQVLLIPGQPLFDVGDRDLLMVKGNNRFPCPLVECAHGRYRYLGGMVVNELGQRLYLDANGQIVMGEKIENEDLNTNQLSENVKIETREVNEIDPEETPSVSEQYPNATTADPDGFVEHMDDKIRQNHTEEQLANLPPFESSDPDQPFTDETYEMGGVAAGMPPEQGGEFADDMPEDERIERELEAAILADFEQRNLTPERQKELLALNKAMEQKHPEFYAEEHGVEVIASARAASNNLVAGPKADRAVDESNWLGWLGLTLVVAGIGCGLWYRARRS